MSILPKSCFEVVCDGGCDDPWEEGAPHFASEADAVDAVGSYGWVVVGVRALCPACAEGEACKLTGHRWPDDGWVGSNHQGVNFRYRHCERCLTAQHDPPWNELVALVDAARIVNGTTGEAPP